MKYSLITLTILTTLFACRKNATLPVRTFNNVTPMYIPNGWRPVGITLDTTDNGIDDAFDVFLACNADNKGIYKQNGIAEYYSGTNTCDAMDVNQLDAWWWDSTSAVGNTSFYYKEPTESIAEAKYCTIVKLNADSFNHTAVIPRTIVGGVQSTYAKFSVKHVPF
jgi:hypothetical protein